MGVNKTIIDYFNEGYKIRRKVWVSKLYIKLVDSKIFDERDSVYTKDSFPSLFCYNLFDEWELFEEIQTIHELWI